MRCAKPRSWAIRSAAAKNSSSPTATWTAPTNSSTTLAASKASLRRKIKPSAPWPITIAHSLCTATSSPTATPPKALPARRPASTEPTSGSARSPPVEICRAANTMAVTQSRSGERLDLRRRPRRRQLWRIRELAGLLAAGALVAAGLHQVYQAKTQGLSAIQASLSARQLLDLNNLGQREDLLPAL